MAVPHFLSPFSPFSFAQQEAIRLEPFNADALTGLGVALRELNRKAEAEAAFRAVVALRPNCGLALGNLAGMYYDQVRYAVPNVAKYSPIFGCHGLPCSAVHVPACLCACLLLSVLPG